MTPFATGICVLVFILSVAIWFLYQISKFCRP